MKRVLSIVIVLILILTGCSTGEGKTEEELRAEIREELKTEMREEADQADVEQDQVEGDIPLSGDDTQEISDDTESTDVENIYNIKNMKAGQVLDGMTIAKIEYRENDDGFLRLSGEKIINGKIYFDDMYNDYGFYPDSSLLNEPIAADSVEIDTSSISYGFNKTCLSEEIKKTIAEQTTVDVMMTISELSISYKIGAGLGGSLWVERIQTNVVDNKVNGDQVAKDTSADSKEDKEAAEKKRQEDAEAAEKKRQEDAETAERERQDELAATKDYNKGYTVSVEGGSGYITYSNGYKEMVLDNVKYLDFLRSDNKKLFVLCNDKTSYRYDVSSMTRDTLPLNTYTTNMVVVQGGDYDGYLGVEVVIEGVTEYRALTNNSYNSYTGITLSSLNRVADQIDGFNNQGFKYVVDDLNLECTEVDQDSRMRAFNYSGDSYIEITDGAYVLGKQNNGELIVYNGYGGQYSADIYNGADAKFSGGLIFNVTDMGYLDNFTGYRLDFFRNGPNGTATVRLIKKNGSSEETIVENPSVAINTTAYEYNELRLVKNGIEVHCTVNGVTAFISEGEGFGSWDAPDGYFGLFGIEKITFTRFKVESLGY